MHGAAIESITRGRNVHPVSGRMRRVAFRHREVAERRQPLQLAIRTTASSRRFTKKSVAATSDRDRIELSASIFRRFTRFSLRSQLRGDAFTGEAHDCEAALFDLSFRAFVGAVEEGTPLAFPSKLREFSACSTITSRGTVVIDRPSARRRVGTAEAFRPRAFDAIRAKGSAEHFECSSVATERSRERRF